MMYACGAFESIVVTVPASHILSVSERSCKGKLFSDAPAVGDLIIRVINKV